jgi:uncharacterized protein (DUF305 family)
MEYPYEYMELKHSKLVIGLLALIIGLGLGYILGTTTYRMHWGVQGKGGWTKNTEYRGSMHGAMGGMMMGLNGKTGDELDKAFLEGMIVHHEGAIEMSKALIAGTKRPELIKLGNDIIIAQTKEIEMMRQWGTQWFSR